MNFRLGIVLAAAALSASLQAAFVPGPKTLLAVAGLRVLGAVAFTDDCLFVLGAGSPCPDCLLGAERAGCADHGAYLVLFQRKAGLPGKEVEWASTRLDAKLPAASLWLQTGPNHTLLVNTVESLVRLHLVRQGDSWRVFRSETAADWRRLPELGPAAVGMNSLAARADGSLVVGFARSVALLPAKVTRDWPEKVRWLLKPEAEAKGAGSTGDLPEEKRGMIVAADADGSVLALDRRTRALFRLDPAKGGKALVAGADCWPSPEFTPVDAALCGRELIVVGWVRPDPRARAMMVPLVLPAPGQMARPTGLWMETIKYAPFSFTPGGHMLLADIHRDLVWYVRNGAGVTAEAKTEALDASGEVADRAFAALMQELEEEERHAARAAAGKEERKALPADADAPAPEADAGGAGTLEAEPVPVLSLASAGFMGPRRGPASSAPRSGAGGSGAAGGWRGPASSAPRSGAGAGAPGGAAQDSGAAPARAGGVHTHGAAAGRFPAGRVNQRDIAAQAAAFAAGTRFQTGFAAWAERTRRLAGAGGTAMAEWVAGADHSSFLEVPKPVPQGLGQFTLSEAALLRAARWMLLRAGSANPPEELNAWLAKEHRPRPLFSFGLYEHARESKVILEVADLSAVAGQVDRLAGGTACVAPELAAADGITGLSTARRGLPQFAYGLTLVLGPGNRSIASLHPGGATAPVHRWCDAQEPEEPETPGRPSEQPAAPPPERPGGYPPERPLDPPRERPEIPQPEGPVVPPDQVPAIPGPERPGGPPERHPEVPSEPADPPSSRADAACQTPDWEAAAPAAPAPGAGRRPLNPRAPEFHMPDG
jgi:hypothetical protein